MNDYDRVVLNKDLPDEGFCAGDMGCIVYTHAQERAFEVEFFNLIGDTLVVVTLEANEIRPARSNEIAHVREMASA